MIHWLAADPAPQGSGPGWVAYITLGVPITAAIVAGLFQLRTTRKAPHEKLEKLIGILNAWPDDVPGRETVLRSVELTLSQIRGIEKHDELPKLPRSEKVAGARSDGWDEVDRLLSKYDKVESQRRDKSERWAILQLITAGLATTAAATNHLYSGDRYFVLGFAAVLTTLVVIGPAVLRLIRRRRDSDADS